MSMAPVWRCAVAVGLLAVLAGCSRPDPGPTVEQAGRTLEQHITKVVKSTGPEEMMIIDPGGKDVVCGTDGVKRTYGVRFTYDRTDSNLLALLAGTLSTTWDYDVHTAYSYASPRTTLKFASSRTSITFEQISDHEGMATGETDCIPRG